jgi:transcriptional regulator with XRE-family HTH domain
MADSHPLKKYRDAHKITQVALAKELGVTNVTVWRWENGRRTPRLEDARNIARVTGLSAAELLGLDAKERA